MVSYSRCHVVTPCLLIWTNGISAYFKISLGPKIVYCSVESAAHKIARQTCICQSAVRFHHYPFVWTAPVDGRHGRKEGDRFALIEAEYKKKIEDAQKSNEDLRRKLEQGSQQLQGEVLELELENTLIDAFRHDRVEEVKKGVRGADVLQTVCPPAGQICGRIIWEAKRAENWSERWLQELKDDQQNADARIAVRVTTALPKGCHDPFFQRDGVWIVSPHLIRPVAEALRMLLLETHKVALINTGREEKMELLYGYLTSENFARKIRTVVECFVAMKSQLDAEKRAMQKQWGVREMQINRVTETMATFVGELQAIA